MRTEKELLQLMLDHPSKMGVGLCFWSSSLIVDNIITHHEFKSLRNYIHDNRPSKYSSLSAYRNRDNSYYWDQGDIAPRIKWIKKQIKKL